MVDSKITIEEYYSRLRAISIGDVARKVLAGRITAETATNLYCDCTRHVSQSKRSLDVDLPKGLWICRACSKGGDHIDLVEFIRHGVITRRGVNGRMTETHREARNFVADVGGIAPLTKVAQPGEIEAVETRKLVDDSVLLALSTLAKIQHEAIWSNEKALAFCRTKWGLTDEIISRYRIGLSRREEYDELLKAGFDERVIMSTGAFRQDRDDHYWPFFNRRVTFPYYLEGRVVYMIGRFVPGLTDDSKYEDAKYKKLPTYSEHVWSHVSKAIAGTAIWGEGILAAKPKRVVIAEGIVDAIWSEAAGMPTISPVTTSFPEKDIPRFVQKLKNAGTEEVLIVEDNEVSGIGLESSLKLAARFETEGITCRVGLLPLREANVNARKGLAALLGDTLWSTFEEGGPAQRRRILDDAFKDRPQDASAAKQFIEAAKMDIAEFFRTGGTPEEFNAVLDAARNVREIAIERVKLRDNPVDLIRAIEPLLSSISSRGKAEQDALLKQLKERTNVPLATLRSEMSRAKKKTAADPAARRASMPTVTNSAPGSCTAIVEQAVLDAAISKEPVNWGAVANLVFEWFESHEGHFFRTADGEPYLYFEKEIFSLSSKALGGRDRLNGLLLRQTGLVATSAGGRQLFPALAHLAADRGQVRELTTWCAWNPAAHTLYFDLANERNEIAKITPCGVEIVPNGVDSVILRTDRRRFRPVTYDADGGDDAIAFLERAIGDHLACDAFGRRIAILWTASLPLIALLDSKPMLRSQGPSGSGKSFVTKAITKFWYGSTQDENASVAALYAQAVSCALLALDNLETKDATDELINFILGLVTGAARSKRARNSDSDTVQERPMSMALSNGIEGFAPDRAEAVNRTFVILCDPRRHNVPIIESEKLEEIRGLRDRGISTLLRHTSKVLAAIKDGKLRVLYENLSRRLGDHPKRRCNYFLAMMLLHERIAVGRLDATDLEVPTNDPFPELVAYINGNSSTGEREADPVALAIEALFVDLSDPVRGAEAIAASGLDVSDDGQAIRRARATHLFLAMARAAKDRGLRLPFKHANQLAVRLRAANASLVLMGVRVNIDDDRHLSVPVYTLIRTHPRAAKTRGNETNQSPSFDIDDVMRDLHADTESRDTR